MKIVICICSLILITISACNRISTEEKLIINTIGQTINLQMFDIVKFNDTMLSKDELLNEYKFISLVDLQEGCNKCYIEYLKWHSNIDSTYLNNNYTVLFIIHSDNFNTFINNLQYYDSTFCKSISPFYYVLDPEYKFLDYNKGIDKYIIERTLLIDRKGTIRLVGRPFDSLEMKELFLRLCDEQRNNDVDRKLVKLF